MSTHDDDTDPTGMRALLGGLPDPGPMPADLVARIQASLAEQAPLDHDVRADLPSFDGVSRGTPDRSRPSWWARHAGHAAVAAVVLLGGGALASGPLGLLDTGVGTTADTQSGADTSGGGAESGTPLDADTASPPTDEQMARSAALGAVVVRHSGRNYTTAGLTTQLGALESGPTTSPLKAQASSIGPMGTELGVRSCLEALGLPRGTATAVDLGALDGAPAAVLVVTVGGERTAYAVGRDCTTGNPALLAGPVTLP